MRRIFDTSQPNLMRHVFPTHRVPRLSLAEGALPVEVPQRAWLIEATLSQGILALETPRAEQATRLLELLELLDNESGLLRQLEVRVVNGMGRGLLEVAIERLARAATGLTPVAVIAPEPEAVRGLEDLGLRGAGIEVGVSDFQTHLGRGGQRQALVASLTATMDACLALGIQPRVDLLDVTRADLEGFLFPLVEACLEHLARNGAAQLVLRLCDTLGLGLPWAEAPTPRSIPRLVHAVRGAMGLQPRQLEFLGANDLGLALSNSLAALTAGCSGLVCALGGAGERGGVTPTELALIHLCGLYGAECDLTALAPLLSGLAPLGLGVGDHHPLWGEEALTTSNLPADRPMDEVGELYAPFDTGRLLARAPRVEVRPGSGPAGIAHLLRGRFPSSRLLGRDERVQVLHRWVVERGLRRVSWDVLEPKVRELMPELFGEEG